MKEQLDISMNTANDENIKKKAEETENKRNLKGSLLVIANIVAVAASIFHLYSAYAGQLFALTHRSIHLAFIMFLGYIYFCFSRKQSGKVPKIDIALSILSVLMCVYVIVNVNQLVYRAGEPILMDWIFGIITVLLVLELTRRVVGDALAIIAVIFLIYAYFGPYMPGIFIHSGYSPERIFSYLYMSLDGIFGVPIGVSADFIFLFILFGTFLEKSGAGRYFIDLAFALTGKSRGGPAKASVLASGLLGSISGSSVANAVTSGTFTLPLMKKVGYSSHFSAGVEAAASTGGQLMPPIMGAAAFIMAEFIGVEFSSIALAALVPAILYFVSLIAMVHFRAGRMGLEPTEDSPDFFPTFIKGIHLLTPLVLLIAMLFMGFSPQRAIAYAIGLIIIVMVAENIYKYFFKKEDKTSKQFYTAVKTSVISIFEGFRDGAVKSVQVAIACACAGIIVGVVTMSGLGLKLAGYIEVFSGGVLIYGLVITMFSSLILGIGLPTTAKYIVLATIVGPALTRMGVSSVIAAHLFILYFATDADITPPVSLTAYATAGIAGAKPILASVEAFKLGLSAYLIPFVFIYNSGLILQGEIHNIILTIITALIGIIALSSAIQGFLFDRLRVWTRLLIGFIAVVLVVPNIYTDLIGISLLALILFLQRKKIKNKILEN